MTYDELITAVCNEEVNQVKVFLENGISPNASKEGMETPLSWAGKRIDLIKLLLLYEADVNYKPICSRGYCVDVLEIVGFSTIPFHADIIKHFRADYNLAIYMLAVEFINSAADAKILEKAAAIMNKYAPLIVKSYDKPKEEKGDSNDLKFSTLVSIYTNHLLTSVDMNEEKAEHFLGMIKSESPTIKILFSPEKKTLRQQILQIKRMGYLNSVKEICKQTPNRTDLAKYFLIPYPNLTYQLLAEAIRKKSQHRNKREIALASGLAYFFGIHRAVNKVQANAAFFEAANLGLPEGSFWYAYGLSMMNQLNDVDDETLKKIVDHFEKAHLNSTDPSLRTEVINHLETLLVKFPKNKLLSQALGHCFFRDAANHHIDLLQRAKEKFQDALEENEKCDTYNIVCYQLGCLLNKATRYQEAHDCYQIAHNRGHILATLNLAELTSSGRLNNGSNIAIAIDLYTHVITLTSTVLKNNDAISVQKKEAQQVFDEAIKAISILIPSANLREEKQAQIVLAQAQSVMLEQRFQEWILVKDKSVEDRDVKIRALLQFVNNLEEKSDLKEKAEFYLGITIAQRQEKQRLRRLPEDYATIYEKFKDTLKILPNKAKQNDIDALQKLSSYHYFLNNHNRAFFYALAAALLDPNRQNKQLIDYSNPGIKTDLSLNEAGSNLQQRLKEYQLILNQVSTVNFDDFDSLVRFLLKLEKELIHTKQLTKSRILDAVRKESIKVNDEKKEEVSLPASSAPIDLVGGGTHQLVGSQLQAQPLPQRVPAHAVAARAAKTPATAGNLVVNSLAEFLASPVPGNLTPSAPAPETSAQRTAVVLK